MCRLAGAKPDLEIPEHMKHLPVHGGKPVPWVVSTTKGRMGLTQNVWGFCGGELMVIWEEENDIPDFAKYDLEKHRQCMMKRFCHVCHRDGEEHEMVICDPKRVFPLDGQTAIWPNPPRKCAVLSQPWACRDCLLFSSQHCPPLSEAIKEKRGIVFESIKGKPVSVFYRAVNPEDPVVPDGMRAVLAFKVMVESAKVETLAAWVKKAGAK